MSECPHGLEAIWCADCQRIPASTVDDWSRPFTAAYPGRCDGCPEGIDPGDHIRVSDGVYRHARCVDQ